MTIDLWNPSYSGLYLAFLISYLLGIVHGITPDEHTWPITFSYAVGTYSTRKGMKVGMIFSAGFTIQRAILSEISFFALAGIFMTAVAIGITYVIVGIAMAAAGIYLSSRNRYIHFHVIERALYRITGIHRQHPEKEDAEMRHTSDPMLGSDYKPIPIKLAFLHGFIAGFGFGAFALIIYTVMAPSMPSLYLGFMPGLLFGLGTMTMQIILGAGFATWMKKNRKINQDGIKYVAGGISRYVLKYGGFTFVIVGILVLGFPGLLDISFVTPLMVHNLHSLGIGFFLVLVSVMVFGFLGYRNSMKKALLNNKYTYMQAEQVPLAEKGRI
ncbi:MAG: hypothetical protein M1454_02415 [Candidatus Thermoplasmatota archaeon]|nr:hypothetical protein [Candidatus Thermoplasmatota archaeon]MCL5731450.1 hypothetical protein [Candidatus Thermoplasmatota archaeon]